MRYSDRHASIGGYFELELGDRSEYYPEAIRLNTGRNALEMIIRTRNYTKVYIPFYTCASVLSAINRAGVKYSYYPLNENLEPEFDFNAIRAGEAFLYTNYFGLKDRYISALSRSLHPLIIDNAQAFFSRPLPGIDTFYSARKFFGVPDGAYLSMATETLPELETDISIDRYGHLIGRIEYGPEAGYPDFCSHEKSLFGQPILAMSNLTRRILSSIDYETVKAVRNRNFFFLHDMLHDRNALKFALDGDESPMIYPFMAVRPGVKDHLIRHRIYVATYWREVDEMVAADSFEHQLVARMIPLPIDQRYTIEELSAIPGLLMEDSK